MPFEYIHADIKWKEPYASFAINRKHVDIVDPGFYLGFEVAAPATGMVVTVKPDELTGRSTAVVKAREYQLTVRSKGEEDFTIPAGKKTSLVLSVYYKLNVDTSAVVKLVDTGAETEDDLVLCDFDVPTGATNLTQRMLDVTRRSDPKNYGIGITLEGPKEIWQGQTNTYQITNYSDFVEYSAATSSPNMSAQFNGAQLTISATQSIKEEPYIITLYADKTKTTITVQGKLPTVKSPAIVSPVNGDTNVATTPTLTAGAFITTPVDRDTHLASQWQISLTSSFRSVIFDSGEDAANLLTVNPGVEISAGRLCYWRVRHKGSLLGWSEWSQPAAFASTQAKLGLEWLPDETKITAYGGLKVPERVALSHDGKTLYAIHSETLGSSELPPGRRFGTGACPLYKIDIETKAVTKLVDLYKNGGPDFRHSSQQGLEISGDGKFVYTASHRFIFMSDDSGVTSKEIHKGYPGAIITSLVCSNDGLKLFNFEGINLQVWREDKKRMDAISNFRTTPNFTISGGCIAWKAKSGDGPIETTSDPEMLLAVAYDENKLGSIRFFKYDSVSDAYIHAGGFALGHYPIDVTPHAFHESMSGVAISPSGAWAIVASSSKTLLRHISGKNGSILTSAGWEDVPNFPQFDSGSKNKQHIGASRLLDNGTGFVTLSGGRILATYDFGNAWIEVHNANYAHDSMRSHHAPSIDINRGLAYTTIGNHEPHMVFSKESNAGGVIGEDWRLLKNETSMLGVSSDGRKILRKPDAGDQLEYTEDGGENWVLLPAYRAGIATWRITAPMVFDSGRLAIMENDVGSMFMCYYTDNLGVTWHETEISTNHNAYMECTLSVGNERFVAGRNAKVLATTDAVTWRTAANFSLNINNIDISEDRNIIYAATPYGRLYKSVGGADGVKVNGISNSLLEVGGAVCCSGDGQKFIFIKEAQNQVHYSENGGSSVTIFNLTDIGFPAANITVLDLKCNSEMTLIIALCRDLNTEKLFVMTSTGDIHSWHLGNSSVVSSLLGNIRGLSMWSQIIAPRDMSWAYIGTGMELHESKRGVLAPPPQNVFSVDLYTGNGADQSINNGLNLASGGMVDIKARHMRTQHFRTDSSNGDFYALNTNHTRKLTHHPLGVSLTDRGFNVGQDTEVNNKTVAKMARAFKTAPRFFDIVKITVTAGQANKRLTIPHDLGIEVGMVELKQTNTSDTNWYLYHRSLPVNKVFYYDDKMPYTSNVFNSEKPTESEFYVNLPAGEFIVYLYAHDPSPEGIIICDVIDPLDKQVAYYDPNWGVDGAQYVMSKNSLQASHFPVTDSTRRGQKTLLPDAVSIEHEHFSGNGIHNDGTGKIAFHDWPADALVHFMAIRAPII